MANDETVEQIILAIKKSIDELADTSIDSNTLLRDIPGLDSMQLVNLHMNLKDVFGSKIDSILPDSDMSVSDLASIIDEL